MGSLSFKHITTELIFDSDAEGGKPWIDGGATSMRDFWNANALWLPTWGKGEDSGMTVKC